MANVERRKSRCRYKVLSTTKRPYVLSVRKTNQYMYVQLDEIASGKTLLTTCSKSISDKKLNKDIAKQLGAKVVEMIKAKFNNELPQVAYDRSGYKYHGRIKELADSAREAGLDF